jgi:hypothetical protein
VNRRAFFSTLRQGATVAVAAPYLPLLKSLAFHPVIHIRKMMARIRITQEAMDTPSQGAFVQAWRSEMSQLARDIQYREERAMLRGGRGGWFWR